MWNRLQNLHSIPGSFGYFVDAQISGISSPAGDGMYTFQVMVIDSTNGADTVLPFVYVAMNNQAQSASSFNTTTDENGLAIFNMNSGDYVVLVGQHAYQAIVDSVTISGAAVDTIYTYRIARDGTAIAFRFQRPNGTHYAGAIVEVDLVAPDGGLLNSGDTLIGEAHEWSVTETADDQGLCTVYLYPNSIWPDSTYYKFRAHDRTGRIKLITDRRGQVPDTSAVIQFYSLDLSPG
jgi:hypothetical protein